jgi:primosomal protein N' (replication factor Y)
MDQEDQLFLLADPVVARKRVRPVVKKIVEITEVNPIARVRVNVPVSHLDRDFDYLVPAAIEARCRIGDRVRVRFSGKLADAIVVDRIPESEFTKLAPIERAIGPALTPETLDLVQAVAHRYVGMFWDVVRAAVPNKSRAGANRQSAIKAEAPVSRVNVWATYSQGRALLEKLSSGECVRAIWASAPASLWWEEMAELVHSLHESDSEAGIILLVPDALSIERLVEAIPSSEIISTHLGQGQRYKNFLEVHSGRGRIVVGTRSAVFAPVENLKAIIMWDDFNDAYADAHAPYWDAREVAALRSHKTGCSLIVGGFSRSVTTQSWCESGWCESITANKFAVDAVRSQVRTLTDTAIERDPHQSRIPQIAWQAIHESLPLGPVLVSVGRRGYIPAFLCKDCGERAMCVCGGAIQQGNRNLGGEQLTCSRCGTTGWRCDCGGTQIKALAIGAERTAEELGRAFAGTPVVWSQQEHVVTDVDSQSRIVVATQGAEPFAKNGFAAVVIVDMFAHSVSLTASESLLRRTFSAAVRAKVGAPIVVTGDPGQRESQAVARWDSPWFAGRELQDRSQAHLPPSTRVALIIGERDAVLAVAAKVQERVGARLMGPIDGENSKVFLMVRRADGNALSQALGQIMHSRSADPKNSFVRIHMDPRDF